MSEIDLLSRSNFRWCDLFGSDDALNPRYKDCFACTTAQAFAKALSQAGYATDPAYSDKVIGLIKQHNLLALDGEAP